MQPEVRRFQLHPGAVVIRTTPEYLSISSAGHHPHYSVRSTRIGSTEAAHKAGSQQASSPASTRIAAIAPKAEKSNARHAA
jgi:hypothetical protein